MSAFSDDKILLRCNTFTIKFEWDKSSWINLIDFGTSIVISLEKQYKVTSYPISERCPANQSIILGAPERCRYLINKTTFIFPFNYCFLDNLSFKTCSWWLNIEVKSRCCLKVFYLQSVANNFWINHGNHFG